MRIRKWYEENWGVAVEGEDGSTIARFFYQGNPGYIGNTTLSEALALAGLFIVSVEEKPMRIMSGEQFSRDIWKNFYTAKTVGDLRDALFSLCCRLQQLESRFSGKGK
jgi:hypothetical protein